LSTTPPARLSAEMQKIPRLSKEYSIGDWYFYQNHTVIRIYGCELTPCKLPKYVLIRLFALEYYRQFNSADLAHLYGARKKAQLKIRHQLGPFIFNKREEAWKEADIILRDKLKLKQSFHWSPYDPEHFISFRRVKNKLTWYVHQKIPEIEQYANQQEWVEGTLVEEFTEEDKTEKAIKDLEQTLDLDSFGQVTFTLPQQIGADTSSTTASQQPAQESAPPAGTSKGKEVQHLKQQGTMADRPDTTKEQNQGQGPSTQTKAPEIPVLQTPLNEERAKKRDKQGETPTGGSTKQQGEKRQRLNPYSEEELPEQTTGQQAPSVLETSTSSFQQEQERQHGVEVTSTRQQSKQGSDIKKAFTKIKARNELVRLQLYNQLLRMAPTNQQRLMAAYDIQEGKMTLSHFRPTTQQPQSVVDYIRTNLEVLSKDIHPMD